MKKNSTRIFGLLFILFFLFPFVSPGAYLRNVPQVITQPNGVQIKCLASGDEFWHRLHDENGFTIVQDPKTGYFVYAMEKDGDIIPSKFIAGTVDPGLVGLKPHAAISPEKWSKRAEEWRLSMLKYSNEKKGKNQGSLNNIVVFIRFQDDEEFDHGFDLYNQMFNGSSTGQNSMHNYFKEVSYNTLSITSSFYPGASNNTIKTYIDPNPRSYYQPYNGDTNTNGYSGNDQKKAREFTLLRNAVLAIKGKVPTDLNIDADNDGKVDNVCFIIKGDPEGWGDLLWPHMWTLDENYYVTINQKQVYTFNFQLESFTISNTSVLCHEMFHALGAPDLYHYNVGQSLRPVGYWDLMEHNTEPAQSVGAYMKFKYGGWINSIPEITETGEYELSPLNSSTPDNTCYKIPISNSTSNEFIVLEYRVKEGTFESSVPGSGLLIYRIWPNAKGNAQYDGTTVFDEVYIYRPGGSLAENGEDEKAFFSDLEYRTSFSSDLTDPDCILTNNVFGNITITNVKIKDNGKISFRVVMPGDSYMVATPEQITFSAASGKVKNISISSNIPDWTVQSGVNWISAEKNETGDGIILKTIEENLLITPRSSDIAIEANGIPSSYIHVIQSGAEPYLTVSPRTLTVGGFNGASAESQVSTNIPGWDFLSEASWITLEKQQENNVIVVRALSDNTGTIPRQAIIKINAGDLQSNLIVTQDISTGENEITLNRFLIYPNPTDGVLKILFDKNSMDTYTIQVFDVLGHLVYENIISSEGKSEAKIDLTDLRSGIYIISVNRDKNQYTQRIILN